MTDLDYDVVIPTLARPSLPVLLDRIATWSEPRPGRIWIVHDRAADPGSIRPPDRPRWLAERLRVLGGPAKGPAAARNVGWRASGAAWVVFLDDDVLPSGDWPGQLAQDLSSMGPDVAGSQGTIRVPLPVGRRPTDWERNVAGLEGARWATADMAYRRSALERVGGFDERFRRAYREDADLALRIIRAGFQLTRGSREVLHPVRPADGWASLRVQAGNADDALMAALHGREWPEAVGASRGRRPAHMATTVLAAAMISGVVTGQRWLAVAGGVGWLAATGDLAWRRIAPGPRTLREIVGMVATSPAMPPVATAYWLAGLVRGFWLTWGHRRESPPVRRRHVQNGVERQVA